jgi:penicillin-binding protein 1B
MKPRMRRILLGAGLVAALGLVGLGLYVVHLDQVVREEFEGRRWDVPARVYALPTELYVGMGLSLDDLEQELRQLHYRVQSGADTPGTYQRHEATIDLYARRSVFADEVREATRLSVTIGKDGIQRMVSGRTDVPVFRLDPLMIGSITPIHGEDRIVLAPADVPPLLPAALKTVEDRRFDTHGGVDPKGLLRAVWVDLRAGHLEQGGSTLTQQLVKNYFLDERRSLGRKLKEAIMATRLEAHFSKSDILTAYINEIFLGQDGERAIHGFGLASQFYFAKPLNELNLPEIALLTGMVRGPSVYDPRRHPEAARARRDRVLTMLADEGVVTREAAATAKRAPLGIRPPESGSYYPAYMDFVRRTLKRDYREADLAKAGLSIYTSLDPHAQLAAERALTRQLARLEPPNRRKGAPLQGSVVVTLPETGDVVAIVGGRDVGFDGFNRALDARRPIGSLVKPVVYLSALETGRYTAGSIVEDAPVDLPLSGGDHWTPENYTHLVYGPVTLVHALAESMNLATVHLGLDVGVKNVAAAFPRLGLDRTPAPNPSLLLGAVDMAPIEVAQIYNSLANGGFQTRLRAVRAVLGEDGKPLKTFPLQVAQAAPPASVYALGLMMEAVMSHGTGHAGGARLRPVVTAGKTGTSSDTRDSWFAGFSGSHLVVVWVGFDDNRVTGLTGALGALPAWTETMLALRPTSFDPAPPEGVAQGYVDFETGRPSAPGCPGTPVPVAVVAGTGATMIDGCEAAARAAGGAQSLP